MASTQIDLLLERVGHVLSFNISLLTIRPRRTFNMNWGGQHASGSDFKSEGRETKVLRALPRLFLRLS